MTHVDALAERRAELARRLAALSPEKRAQLEGARAIAPIAPRRGGIVPREPGSPVPMSYAQELLWLLERANPGIGYNVPRTLRLRGTLHVAALQAALDGIVARHEVLRSTFDLVDGEPRQIVHEPAPVAIAFTDLGDRAPEQREADARALVRELSRRPFDLTRDAQLRTSLIRLDAEDHVLLLESHHVASDAWSRGILLRELSALYGAHRRGGEAALAPLPIQYGDYARWQRETLQGAELERHLAFWREQLRDAPALLELPTDRPRPAAPSFDGALRTRLMPPALLERLREVSRANGATLFVTLLAAFDVLLSKLSGQRDIVVGTPTAGRSHESTEGLIGFFVNTVALRTRLDGDPTFIELLGRVRETTLSVFEHQDVPFEKLTLELQRAGELGRHGVFQVAFTMQDGESRSVELPGLVCESYGSSRGATKFDLTLGMQELPSGLRATIEYRTDLFDADTIDRMLSQLGAVLEAVSEAPGVPLSAVALLTGGERDLLLREWAGPRRDYPTDVSIHSLIEAQVDRTPDAPALTFEEETISYAEMDARANRLAHLLRERGVESGQLVGVCLERSVEMIVSLLAIMKAGAAYVPLDPEYPRGRLAFMLEDSTPAATVTRRAERDALPDEAKQLVVLDDPEVIAALARTSCCRPAERVSGDALAYAIYTSGSTGRPKGALNQHSAVVNRLLWSQDTFRFTASDAVMQKTPYSFDVSVVEFFGTLLAGARLVIARPGGHRDPAYLQQLIEREEITSVHFVPSMLEAFLPFAQRERLATLRIMQCSGEALLPASVARAYDVLPSGAEVHNLYGPTECAVDVTHWVCPRDPSLSVVPIGRPVANTRCYVLAEAKRLVPVGVPGELYLAGRQVGAGYLLRPELTDERFVADPYADPTLEPRARMYRTGDRVRWRDDGTIEYLGRLDFQVKIRGLRIETGEIESTLVTHEAVAQAAVVLRGERGGELVAYVVPDPEGASAARRLVALDAAPEAKPLPRFDLPNGMTVFHRNASETEFLFKEIFEGEGYLRHGLTVGESDVVFDVGANIGVFTLFAGAQGARVYAFEPIPPVYDVLSANAALHDVPGRVFPCGLGSRAETVSFTYYPENTVLSGRFASVESETSVLRRYLTNVGSTGAGRGSIDELLSHKLRGEEFACSIRTLSDVVREEGIDRIDLLKIDVEKAEWDVLQGIDDADWPKIRQLVLEVHDLDGRLAQVLELLRRHGYECVSEEEDMLVGTGLYAVYAWRAGAARARPASSLPSRPHKSMGTGPLRESLQRHLAQYVPGYMVPSAFVFLDALPLTSSGKLDRTALPAPAGTTRRREYRAARTTIEHELVQIWESLLGVSPIGMHDDFFELGGHSLLAVRMLVEVARLRGREIPLTWLFESSTIHALAARIDVAVQGTPEPPIVVLQGDAPGTPIAFVHGDVRGAGWYCRRLAPLLAPDSPFFVLPTLGADGDPEVWTIESMAARHLSELRKVRPHGPYSLVGFCVGGKIVLEMAQQLRAAGETIERLVMIDSGAGNAAISYMRPILPFVTGPDATARLARQATIMKRVRWYDARIRWAASQDLRRQLGWLATNVARRVRKVAARIGVRTSAGLPRTGVAPVERIVRDLTEVAGEQVLRRQSDAVNVYIPRPYPGTIDLVWAESAPNVGRRDPTRGWWRVADQVHVHTIVAHHLDLITNKLPEMANVLRAILERAPE